MIIASQVTGPPKACMENVEMSPSSSVSESDLLAKPTRKRKTLYLDHQIINASNGPPKMVLDYRLLGSQNLIKKFGSIL
ncbi:hypothetical protein Scep_024001 [Stephania cephalantha]|uniref:Uncharacterized protein n=1 Tax=Stephania cephalantha TaxID=152367 RepID=A0AAP0EWU8_9MAGN